jgi:ADP-ribosyl-[dinitrogen reductase] hydrolase
MNGDICSISYTYCFFSKERQEEMEWIDRMKGGLIGLAIGGALGATTEFMTQEQIRLT